MSTRGRRAAPRAQAAPIPSPAAASFALWCALALAAAVGLIYLNSLSGPFILDDEATIVQNPRIRDLTDLGRVLVPEVDTPLAGRPLPSLSFALNYAWGGLDVRGYHAVNIALHLVCTLLLFLAVRRTLELPRVLQSIGHPLDVAWGAALLWGVHPLNSEVVDYLSQRTESLMAACYLLTLYAAIRGAEARARDRHTGRWDLAAVLACASGMACKESMITAPLIVAVFDRVFVFDSWRSALASRRRLYAGLAATWAIAVALSWSGPRSKVAGLDSGVSPWTYLLNQAQMITEYLRLTIWPDPLVVFYGWPLPLTFTDVAGSFAFVTALVLLTIVALWRWPAIGFHGAWFFITLAPASSIVPVATEVGAERRMYLPLMALAVLAMIALDVVARHVRGSGGTWASLARRWTPIAAAVAMAGVLAPMTMARNREYASALTLARTVVERRPTAIAHHILAEQLLFAGQRDEAARHLRVAIDGGNSRAHYVLGRLLLEDGKRTEGIQQLQAYLQTSALPYRLVPRWLEPPLPEVILARYALAQAYGQEDRWNDAREEAEKILQVAPTHIPSRGLLADIMFAQRQWPDAAVRYREYLGNRPNDIQALINYGVTQVAVERFDEAIAAFTRAAELDPANARARQLLTMAREDRARLAAAR